MEYLYRRKKFGQTGRYQGWACTEKQTNGKTKSIVRTQQGDSHQQAKERSLRKTNPTDTLISDF